MATILFNVIGKYFGLKHSVKSYLLMTEPLRFMATFKRFQPGTFKVYD